MNLPTRLSIAGKRWAVWALAGAIWTAPHTPAAEAVTLDLGRGTVIRFTTPPPILWNGERIPDPRFDSAGNATVAGLVLKRTIERDALGYRIKLAVTNRRAQPIELKALVPLAVTGAAGLLVAGVPLSGWTVFRLARHKNDIPGPFRPAVRNDASRDAAADNSGAPTTDDPSEAGSLRTRFHSDPGFAVTADGQPASSALFIGFDGQTQHLSDVALELDSSGSALARLSARAEFDGVTVAPGATRETHELYLQTGEDCSGLLADHVARIQAKYGARLATKRNVFCTWYFYGREIVAGDLRQDLAELARRPIKFDAFLIDAGWSRRIGDWTAEPARFPDGMREMAGEIRAHGLMPGIWTCPFVIAPNAAALQRYPDLLLRNRAGRPVEFQMTDLGTAYVLDPTSPSAEPFLTELYGRLAGWGYGYFKVDFLRAVVNYGDAVFHDRTADRAQAYRRGMELLRRACGDRAVLAGWGGLFEGSAGLVDTNRPGSDVRGHWDPLGAGQEGTRYAVRMRQTFARACYDERLWTSDQDALQLRRRTLPWRPKTPAALSMGLFTDEEAFSTVVFRFLGGGVVQVSDKLDEVDQDRYDLYKMVIPTYAPVARVFDGWDDYLPEHFVSHFDHHPDLPPWAVVTLCNWNGGASKTLGFKLAEVPGLPAAAAYAAFEFKTQQFLGVFKPEDSIRLDLTPHAARVIRITPLGGDGDYLIGTSLNMSCGMEIGSVHNRKVTLNAANREFPEQLTFLGWERGRASLRTVAAQKD